MARAAQRIHIPNLDPKFVRDPNPNGNWMIERFNANISLLDTLADNLPKSLPWRLSLELVHGPLAGSFPLPALPGHLCLPCLSWIPLLFLEERLLDFIVNEFEPMFRARGTIAKMVGLRFELARSFLGSPQFERKLVREIHGSRTVVFCHIGSFL